MTSRVQKIKFWDHLYKCKICNIAFFSCCWNWEKYTSFIFLLSTANLLPVCRVRKKGFEPYSPQWSVYFPVLLLLITRKHPVYWKWCTSMSKLLNSIINPSHLKTTRSQPLSSIWKLKSWSKMSQSKFGVITLAKQWYIRIYYNKKLLTKPVMIPFLI